MSATVARLVEEVLRLPSDSRTELIEAVLERAEPSPDYLAETLSRIASRLADDEAGRTFPIDAEAAHESVLASLKSQV